MRKRLRLILCSILLIIIILITLMVAIINSQSRKSTKCIISNKCTVEIMDNYQYRDEENSIKGYSIDYYFVVDSLQDKSIQNYKLKVSKLTFNKYNTGDTIEVLNTFIII